MHIVFLANNFPPQGPTGGIVTYTRLMARAWAQAGHQVSVVCQSLDAKRHEDHHEGIRVVRVAPQNYPGSWRDKLFFKFKSDNSWRLIFHKELSWAIWKEIQSWSSVPDLIESPEAFGWSWAVQKYSQLPVAIRVHGPNALASSVDPQNSHLKAEAVNRMEFFCMKASCGVFPISGYMSDYLKSCHIPVTETFPLPLENEQIDLHPRRPSQLIAVGRLIPGKGFETALHVLAQMPKNWELVIVGPDDSFGRKRESYRQYLKRLASKLDIDKRVVFTGALSREETLKRISQATALIHDSSNDNMPYVLLEALASNTPVVATRIGGVPETLNGFGQLVELGDVKAYVDALKKMESQNSREATLDRHDPIKLQKQMGPVYQGLISR